MRIEPTATDASAVLLDQVADGTLDGAFVELPLARGPFSSVVLCSEARMLALPAEAPEHGLEATLAALGLVRLRDCPGTEALIRRIAPARTYGHAVETPAAALALVRAGIAAALVTRGDVDRDDDAIRLLPVPELPPRVIGLAWHRKRDGDPELRDVKELAARTLAPAA